MEFLVDTVSKNLSEIDMKDNLIEVEERVGMGNIGGLTVKCIKGSFKMELCMVKEVCMGKMAKQYMWAIIKMVRKMEKEFSKLILDPTKETLPMII